MEQILMNTQLANENDVKLAEKYLLQIHRIKLIDYINCGLIVPDRYLSDESEKDIQSRNKDFLVVCNGYLKELDEYQILLEIILTEDEKEKLHKVNDTYYFDFPLPVTRIKKVYVQKAEIKKHIQIQIQNSENGFLSEDLFDVYIKRNNLKFNQKQYHILDQIIETNNFEDKIRYFDKRMGIFSFIKNNELYYCNETNNISNYSKHYFSIFSSLLKEPLSSNHFEQLDILNQNESFKSLLYSQNQIDREFIEQEANKIENDQVKEIFLEILKPAGSRDVLFKLLEKNHLEYYLIGLVYYFRQKDNSNKKDNFKIEISNLIPYEVSEISLTILGIYFGYKKVRSSEKIEIQDDYFKEMFGEEFNMKFTFKSKLDYIMVETIYNICFYGKDKKGYEYDYLPYPSKKHKVITTPKDKRFKTFYQTQIMNQHFDVEQITIKKLSTLEVFTHLLGKSDLIVENKQTKYLMPFVQYTFGDILKFNNKGQKYLKKDDLLEKLESTKDQKITNELIDVLNIGKKSYDL